MKWEGRRTSANIEDRRRGGGMRAGGATAGGGAVLLLLASIFFPDAVPILQMFGVGGGGAQMTQASSGPNRVDDKTEEFVGVVLADTEEVWAKIFAGAGQRYQPPKLVLFSQMTRSACGSANAASGPFYCPGDHKIYLDTAFYQVLEQRLGAHGDFAKAYVIAHEVAHHVQNLLGIIPKVDAQRRRVDEITANKLTVRLELQADCFSGVWANHAHRMFGSLEKGDVEEALNAAAAIGDDTLQRRSQGVVIPDSFTHGTSEQRQRWFYTGLKSGDPGSCDTFATDRL